MKKTSALGFSAFVSVLLGCAATVLGDGNSSTIAPLYQVKWVAEEDAPTIDGVISDGEWDAAKSAADKWVNFGSGTDDSHNLRFQMMWDDDHLYVLGRSDYDGFVEGRETSNVRLAPTEPDWNGFGYSPFFFFDPNTDEERTWEIDPVNPRLPVPDDEVDGYHISWDVHLGHAERRPTEDELTQPLRDPLSEAGESVNDYFGGFYIEANANAVNGNTGAPGSQWTRLDDGPNDRYQDDDLPGLEYAQNADNEDLNGTEEPGAIWEWKIAWSVFDATNPDKLVTAEEAVEEFISDLRETLPMPTDHPEFNPFFPNQTIENPNFGEETLNPDWVGDEGDPDQRFADPESPAFLDNGLYAADGPEGGDIWGFDHTVITNDRLENWLPSWAQPKGGDFTRGQLFASWGTTGHGQIEFLEAGDEGGNGNGNGNGGLCAVPTNGILGDLDRDGTVGFLDFLTLSTNFGLQDLSYTAGDIDCDGEIGFLDFLTLSTNFGQSLDDGDGAGVASVPEPSGQLLMLTLLLFSTLVRRRNVSA